MKTSEIESIISYYFKPRINIIVPNVSWGLNFNHELDMLIITKSRQAYEVEIKVSKGDLIKDKLKWHGHKNYRLRKIYFAIPEKLVPHIEHIPEHAGILVCNDKNYSVKVLREAKINSSAVNITDKELIKLGHLSAMRIWNLKSKIRELQNARKST